MTEGAQFSSKESRKPVEPLYLFLGALWIVWCLRATWLYSLDLNFAEGPFRNAYSNLVKFLIWVVPAALYYWLDGQRDLLKSFYLKRRPQRLLPVTALCLAYLGGILLSGLTLEHKSWLGPASLLDASSRLAAVAVSPISEELLFRGFVLPSFCQRISFWKSNLITALLFSSMHWPFWLWHNGPSMAVVQSSVTVFVIGLFLGWIWRISGSIWPPVAMHIANNYLASFLVFRM